MAAEASGVRDVVGDFAHQVQDIGPPRPPIGLLTLIGSLVVHTAQAPETWTGRKAFESDPWGLTDIGGFRQSRPLGPHLGAGPKSWCEGGPPACLRQGFFVATPWLGAKGAIILSRRGS